MAEIPDLEQQARIVQRTLDKLADGVIELLGPQMHALLDEERAAAFLAEREACARTAEAAGFHTAAQLIRNRRS